MNTIITIRCKPEDLERELGTQRRVLTREVPTGTPGWTKTFFPDFALCSVVDTPGTEKIHYVNVEL